MRDRRNRNYNSNLISNPFTILLVVLLFFIILLSSNHFSDYNLLAYSAHFTPFHSSSVDNLNTCKNTKQGKYFVTDDRGFVCNWRDVSGNGCCKEGSATEQFSCLYCNQTAECCLEYEYCISCCLHPDNDIIIKSIMITQDNPTYQAANNNFEFCQARCRTSSESVFFDKEYKSYHKYCYGIKSPSKDADIGIDRNAFEKLHEKNIIGANEVLSNIKHKTPIKKEIDERQEMLLIQNNKMHGVDIIVVDDDEQNQIDLGIDKIQGIFGTSDASSFHPGRYTILFPLVLALSIIGYFTCFTKTSIKEKKE